MENNDIERQKFELEKQKLELAKQKLEFEKSKFKHASSVKTETLDEGLLNTKSTGKLSVLSLVAACVLLITPFLPWVTVGGSGFGASFSASGNGFDCGHGYYILLFAIAAIVLAALKKHKFAFIPGALALIDGITVITGAGSRSISFMGASASSGFAIGPVIVVISSIVLIASSFIKKKTYSSFQHTIPTNITKPIEKRPSIFITYKFELLTGLLSVFILFPVITRFQIDFQSRYQYDNNLTKLIVALVLFSAVPIILLRILHFTKTYKLFFALPIFYIICFFNNALSSSLQYSSFRLIKFLSYDNNISIAVNLNDSLANIIVWFNLVFYITVILTFVIEIIEQRKKTSPTSLSKYKFVSNPTIQRILLFAPFIGFLAYYNAIRHIVTNEEFKQFETTNSYFSGDWYFLDKDSTRTLKLSISHTFSRQADNTGNLKSKFEYKISRLFGQSYGDVPLFTTLDQVFDTTIYYDKKIMLPIKFENNSKLLSVKNNTLSMQLHCTNGTFQISEAVRNEKPLLSIIEAKLSKEMNKRASRTPDPDLLTKNETTQSTGNSSNTPMVGEWDGAFGNNQIALVIDNINNGSVTGYNIVKGNKRALTGTMTNGNNFELNEPGNDKWDGKFQFIISNGTLSGSWTANNGKLTHNFTLTKK